MHAARNASSECTSGKRELSPAQQCAHRGPVGAVFDHPPPPPSGLHTIRFKKVLCVPAFSVNLSVSVSKRSTLGHGGHPARDHYSDEHFVAVNKLVA